MIKGTTREELALSGLAGLTLSVITAAGGGCVAEANPVSAMFSASGGGLGSGGASESASDDAQRLDIGPSDTGGQSQACRRVGDPSTEMCEDFAPPDAFEPELQWSWTDPEKPEVWVTPLVANMTDDNGDGRIDLDDIPDVIVVATFLDVDNGGIALAAGEIAVLSGDTGALHYRGEVPVAWAVTPAVGDIDGDGLPEIVTATSAASGGAVVAFDHEGRLQWSSVHSGYVDHQAVALADLEGDGTVEIIFGGGIYESTGVLRFDTSHDDDGFALTADLDGDGRLEVVYGSAAFRADGTTYYETDILSGFPHVGNFDEDPDPEILVTNQHGMNLLDHRGKPIWLATPSTDAAGYLNLLRPGTIHDFDGDCEAEFAFPSGRELAVYEIDATGPTLLWQAEVQDYSGASGSTAFDFDGDGRAETVYADERQLHVLDSGGGTLLTAPRQSGTIYEYPVVADVDNDGSAEIVVVSNAGSGEDQGIAPAVQVIRDVDERWLQARRIWNQQAYSVVNVNEDGTISAVPAKSWLELNTFRTNAQIEDGTICQPVP